MKLLPDREHSRLLAVGLLLIAAALVYLVGFHWFVLQHLELSRDIGHLETRIARFKATAMHRPMLEARLDELRRERLDSALFLSESNFNTAAASMTRYLRDIINTQADDTELCQIIATQNRPAREPERFEQVTVNVRMQCPLPDVVRLLYELENTVPLIFVDNMIINQRAVPQARGVRRRGGETYGQLDVRFDMYGYLADQGAG